MIPLRVPVRERFLFAVAFEIGVKKGRTLTWTAGGIDYVHAYDEAEARKKYRDSDPRLTRIVACGRALGYFVHDNHGEILSA